jgi:ferredoxin
MSYVITSLCVGVCDTGCVEVCPMDCIEGPITLEEIRGVPPTERAGRLGSLQLYINPSDCICCGACVSECPAKAIFEEDDVPEEYKASIEENANFFRNKKR